MAIASTFLILGTRTELYDLQAFVTSAFFRGHPYFGWDSWCHHETGNITFDQLEFSNLLQVYFCWFFN